MVVPIRDLGARRGWVVNVTPRPLYPQEKGTVHILQEAGWALCPENIAPPGVEGDTLQTVASRSLY